MAPKNTNNKPATVAKAATPKVDPTTLSTPQIYSGEQARQAAIAEVTRLRREFDTTTAKGAKAFAASKEAQAALAALDQAKSNVGMRTAAQDLQALNTVTGQGQTKALNAPSQQYFQSVYNRPEAPPTWAPPRQITEEQKAAAAQQGYNYDKARYDWVWSKNPQTGQDQWVLGVVGALTQAPKKPELLDTSNYQPYASGLWTSGTATVSDVKGIYNQVGVNTTDVEWVPGQKVTLDDLATAVPDLDYLQYQEILYQLSLERDTDITVEDIVNKYNELYGEG